MYPLQSSSVCGIRPDIVSVRMWVKDPALLLSCSIGPRCGLEPELWWLWHRSQLKSSLTPCPGTSVCHRRHHEKIKKKKNFSLSERAFLTVSPQVTSHSNGSITILLCYLSLFRDPVTVYYLFPLLPNVGSIRSETFFLARPRVCGSSQARDQTPHSSIPSCYSDNTRSLTLCTTRDFQILHLCHLVLCP